ncbi:hypothetical protein PF011_g1484 [Phytophthora fragariae]|uniref:Secreted protein n=1 Tax=Phytophthora fragariae TaxID=53985 RepID=A0A6A3MJ34_9STRA|nr:hypothetical protein PF011_g1484 [Phytophthora fragariae]
MSSQRPTLWVWCAFKALCSFFEISTSSKRGLDYKSSHNCLGFADRADGHAANVELHSSILPYTGVLKTFFTLDWLTFVQPPPAYLNPHTIVHCSLLGSSPYTLSSCGSSAAFSNVNTKVDAIDSPMSCITLGAI